MAAFAVVSTRLSRIRDTAPNYDRLRRFRKSKPMRSRATWIFRHSSFNFHPSIQHVDIFHLLIVRWDFALRKKCSKKFLCARLRFKKVSEKVCQLEIEYYKLKKFYQRLIAGRKFTPGRKLCYELHGEAL